MALIHIILDFINKKYYRLFVIYLIFASMVFYLSGCKQLSNVYVSSGTASENNPDKTTTAIICDFAKIYTGNTVDDYFYFYYDLYDKSGTLIKRDCTYMDQPDISMLTDDIIKISVQSGTGISTRWTYYYNLTSNVFSKTYYYVLAEKENFLAFFNGTNVVVCDIFNNEKYYREFELENELSIYADPIESITFSNDLSQMTVCYYSGAEIKKITETVVLE